MKRAIEHFKYFVEKFIGIIIEIFEYLFNNLCDHGKVEADKILKDLSFLSEKILIGFRYLPEKVDGCDGVISEILLDDSSYFRPGVSCKYHDMHDLLVDLDGCAFGVDLVE
jgi:hypothetical protein